MQMREPCRHCDGTEGTIITRSGQDCVYCTTCHRWCYNAPRTETGREQRTLASRPDIKPSRRVRILQSYGGTCVICHRADRPLHVGHLVSRHAAEAAGLLDQIIDSDANLAPFCDECNAGLGRHTLATPMLIRALLVQALT